MDGNDGHSFHTLQARTEVLAERELRYRTLFSRIDQGFCVCAMVLDEQQAPVDYRFVEINDAFLAMTGLPADAVGRTAREMVPGLEQHWIDTYARIALGGESLHFESASEAMGRQFDVFATPVPPHGHFALVFTDVTGRRQAEDALRESERRFRQMADTAPAMLWVTDTGNTLEFISKGWFEQTGQTAEEAYAGGFGWTLAVHPDERPAVQRDFEASASTRAPLMLEYRLRQADGSYRWSVDTGRPRFDDQGQWLGYIGSVVDMHERTEARDALREASRRKDAFVAVLAHELRNPLAPIRTGLEVLRSSPDDAAVAARAQAMMARQIDHIVRLVDDLLDVSRMSTGKIRLQTREANLQELVNSAVDANRATIDERRIELIVQVPAMSVEVDPTRFVQIVSNLVHNAAKFTAPGRQIAIEGEVVTRGASADQLRLSVTDEGEGITPELLATVFEPFTQGSVHGGDGLGIGLALARQLTELHGGEIEAHSDGPGRGSRFTLHLPIQRLDAARDSLAEAEVPQERPHRRVLVVDDNRDAADAMALLMAVLGSEARVGYDGEQALRRVREFRPELVLLDLGMPGMDGYETCRRIRQEPFGGEITIVALTGWGQEQDRRRTLDAGFDDHITKPAEADRLERLLRETARSGDGPRRS